MVQLGGFVEWKEVHGNMYGTPAGPVREALQQGISMILDIDVEGAKEVFKSFPDAIGIFISPPDMTILEQRLRLRGSESDESIKVRLRNAQREMKLARMFRYHIVNDDLKSAVNDLAAIVRKEACINEAPPTRVTSQ
jgi:guanylate kinase